MLAGAFRQYFLEARFSWSALEGNWLDNAHAVVVAAGMLALARRAGSALAGLLGKRSDRLLSTILGLGLLGTAALGTGLAGLLFAPPKGVSLASLAVLAAVEARSLKGRLRLPSPLLPAPLSGLTVAVLVAAAVIILAGLFNMEMSWDALTYHLRVPTFYEYRHKIYDVWHLKWSCFPSNVEMLFALGQIAQGDLTARLLNAACGIMLLAVTARIARRLGAPPQWPVILLAVSPLFMMLITRCYIDLGFSLFLALSFDLLLERRETGSIPALIASSALAGFGLASKYVGALYLLAVIAGMIGVRQKRARIALIWCAASLLPVAPWLIKNWIFTGNPFFPFLSGLIGFPTELPSEWRFSSGGAGSRVPYHALPVVAALGRRAEALFIEHGRIDGPLTLGITGFLPLIFLRPSARRSPDGHRQFAGLTLAAYTAVWIAFYPEIRFYLPVLPVLLALVGAELSPFLGRAGPWRAPFRIVFEAGLIAGLVYGASIEWVFFAPFSFPLGLSNTTARQQVGLPPPPGTWYMKEYVNSRVPKGDRILYASHFSTYYVERECIADFFFGTAHLTKLIRLTGTADGLAKELKRRGIGWILSTGTMAAQYRNISGFFDLTENQWREFKRFLATRSEAVWQTDIYVLYRVTMPHAPRDIPALPVYEALAYQTADDALGRLDAAQAIKTFLNPTPLLADVGSTFTRQGDAFLTMEDAARAERAFRRALKLGADNQRIRLGLAAALMRLNRPKEGVSHAEEAFRQNPLSAYVAATLATGYAAAGRMDDARRAIREAVRLRPDVADYAELARRLKAR